MAARKNNRGRRRNRGRFGFLYVLLSFLLIIAALVAGSVVFFRVDTIEVSGQQRYTQEEIIAAAQVESGDNLFRVSPSRTAQKIMSALPYVRNASIRHDLPDGLTILITESKAAASIRTDAGWFLLDARGKLVELGDELMKSKAAPVTGITPLSPTVGTPLAVAEEEQTKLDALVGLLTALENHGMLDDLTSVDLTASSTVSFGFAGRFTGKMPMSCDYEYKVRSLEYVVGQLEENETGLIDLTQSDETHFIPY